MTTASCTTTSSPATLLLPVHWLSIPTTHCASHSASLRLKTAHESFPGAAEWVDELCLQLVGDNDTRELRNVALAAAAATGACASALALIARGAEFEEFGYRVKRSHARSTAWASRVAAADLPNARRLLV